MVLLAGAANNSSSGSLIDRIGAVLQEKARSSESPPMLPSPPSTHSPGSDCPTTHTHPVDPAHESRDHQVPRKQPTPLEMALSLPFSLPLANPAPSPFIGGIPAKRAASPEETQIKRARLSPESSLSIKTEEDSTPTTADPSPSHPRDESVFCYVPGRLALLNNNSKYPVTINEIKRRLGAPERLNASILGGVLRRAKSKNGGKELRDQLDTIGLDLPAGKRKAFNMTLFTAMVEGEAVHLANDFDFICESEFPTQCLAQYRHNGVTDKEKKKRDLEGAISVLRDLASTLSLDRSPLMNNEPSIILPPSVQDGMSHFSQCTHGFGTPALLAGINTVIRYSEKSLECLSSPPVPVEVKPTPVQKVPVPKVQPTPPVPQQPAGSMPPMDWQNFFNLAALMQMQQKAVAK